MRMHVRLKHAAALLAAVGFVASVVTSTAASAADAPPRTKAAELLTKELVGIPGKEVRIVTVEYPPGGSSPVHRHNASVFVYVLEGTVVMQVRGQAALTLHPGEIFYESPTDIHQTSANASKTEPAKVVVFVVTDKGAALTVPVDATPK